MQILCFLDRCCATEDPGGDLKGLPDPREGARIDAVNLGKLIASKVDYIFDLANSAGSQRAVGVDIRIGCHAMTQNEKFH